MSTVVVVAPIVIAAWPAITAAVVGAVGALGYAIVQDETKQKSSTQVKNKAEVTIDDSEILAGTEGLSEQLVVEKAGVRAVFTRDARGALKVCVEGHGHTKSQLKQMGEELVGRITQQFVYHRLVTDLKERNMPIVQEEVAADKTIKIRVRNW